MARKRASMREGPLAELFRATEAAQRQAEQEAAQPAPPAQGEEPQERTVEHVPTWEESSQAVTRPQPPDPTPDPVPTPLPPDPQPEPPTPRPDPGPGFSSPPEPSPG